jgi:hypothetical protein
MKLYTDDSTVVELKNMSDPVIEWLSQFDYGYTEDIYTLYGQTQDKKLQDVLEFADFAVVTQNQLYKRPLLNEGGFMWPPREKDDWFVVSHSAKERWRYLRTALLGIPRLRLPTFGSVRVRYQGEEDPVMIYWQGGYYVAERNGEIVRFNEMSQEEYRQHVKALRQKGQVF